MKGFLIITLTVLGMSLDMMAVAPSTVHIANSSGDPVYFQPEEAMDYTRVASRDTVVNIENSPVYYRLMDAGGTFYPVFVTPGSHTEVNVSADGVSISGTNERENAFLQANKFLCRTPEGIAEYSHEWNDYNERELRRIEGLLDASGLDPEFVSLQKLYNRYAFLQQKLGGVTLSKIFGRGKKTVEIPEDFYNFLDSLTFDDERILMIPKWFDVVNEAIEVREKRGMIPVDIENYMTVYANQISNAKVRSHYLASLLGKVLKYNYLADFERQYPAVRSLITDSAAMEMLPVLEAEYAGRLQAIAPTAPGKKMPDFVCRDVDGKEYRLSDWKGNYVLVDFWFTGCVPCIHEMPYFHELARDFVGKDIKFVSLSVDTGDQLYPRWEKMIRKQASVPNVMNVNLPEGFNNPLLEELGIRGVPRIMLIGPDGRIVESYAKRPSDPKLRQQLFKATADL